MKLHAYVSLMPVSSLQLKTKSILSVFALTLYGTKMRNKDVAASALSAGRDVKCRGRGRRVFFIHIHSRTS